MTKARGFATWDGSREIGGVATEMSKIRKSKLEGYGVPASAGIAHEIRATLAHSSARAVIHSNRLKPGLHTWGNGDHVLIARFGGSSCYSWCDLAQREPLC